MMPPVSDFVVKALTNLDFQIGPAHQLRGNKDDLETSDILKKAFTSAEESKAKANHSLC